MISLSRNIAIFFSTLFPQLPILLIWIVGIGLAVSRWKRHPQVSRLALIGLSGLLILTIISSVTSALLLPLVGRGEVEQGVFVGVNLGLSLLRTVMWGLVVTAVFGWRRPIDRGR